MQPESDVVLEHTFKVIVIGDYAVGKTSIIKRFTEDTFSEHYKLTIGVDFAVKECKWNSNTSITLQLWDIAGHERFGGLTRVYYKYAIAAVIVYDMQRPATYDAVLKWKLDVDSKVQLANGEPIPCLLLANKSDLPMVSADALVLDEFCKKNGFIGWYRTSAKSSENIDTAMHTLMEKILEVSKYSVAPEADTVALDSGGGGGTPPDDSKCCLTS